MSNSRGRERKVVPEERSFPSGLWAMLMGLIGLMTAFVVVATRWNDESGVAALGAVASSIAAIVTGYFGIQYAQSQYNQSTSTRKRRSR